MWPKLDVHFTYTLSIGVVECFELYYVRVADDTHDLKLAILLPSLCVACDEACFPRTYLEALILKDTLDCCIFPIWRELGLENNAEGSVADDFALGVLHFFSLASKAILNLFTNHLYSSVSMRIFQNFHVDVFYLPYASWRTLTGGPVSTW